MKCISTILSLIIIGSSVYAATREVPVRSGRSLKTQVDSYAELLEKEISRAKNDKEKFRALNRVIDEIKTLRENSPGQSAQDESYMDLMVAVFEAVPAQKGFKKSNCDRYENDILNQFDPASEEDPTEPAVKPGWGVLQSLCR